MAYRILGIGTAACKTAEAFKREKNYLVDVINDETLGAHTDMETYEKKFDSKSLAKVFRKYRKNDEVLIIVSGSAASNGSLLRIAEMIKRCSCSILYLYPSLTWCSPTTRYTPWSVC